MTAKKRSIEASTRRKRSRRACRHVRAERALRLRARRGGAGLRHRRRFRLPPPGHGPRRRRRSPRRRPSPPRVLSVLGRFASRKIRATRHAEEPPPRPRSARNTGARSAAAALHALRGPSAPLRASS